MLNRSQALKWCIKYLEVWPGHIDTRPDGWKWKSNNEGAYLKPALHHLLGITEQDWFDARGMTVIQPQVPVDADRLNLIETMKKRPIDSWSAGDCTVLPNGWAWDGADGMHPHYDQLVRPSDGAVVKFTDVYGLDGVFTPQPVVPQDPSQRDPAAQSAIATLERLGYEWKGGELWKPPIEFDGWNVGDDCWISNGQGHGIADYNRELLGFDTTSKVVSLFTNSEGLKMAAVEHREAGAICWILNMLQRPIVKCNFEHGKNVYVKHDRTFIGRYVGTNPETGEVVVLREGNFASWLVCEVTQ